MKAFWRDGTVAVDPELEIGSPEWHRQVLALERKMADLNYKVLAKTTLADGRKVSTVWLGFDHAIGTRTPQVFETLVFPDQEDMRRYSTEAEAFNGHREVVAEWAAKIRWWSRFQVLWMKLRGWYRENVVRPRMARRIRAGYANAKRQERQETLH